jgi:hypothetical protein
VRIVDRDQLVFARSQALAPNLDPSDQPRGWTGEMHAKSNAKPNCQQDATDRRGEESHSTDETAVEVVPDT